MKSFFTNHKKWSFAGIVLVSAGLLAWSLLALFKSEPYRAGMAQEYDSYQAGGPAESEAIEPQELEPEPQAKALPKAAASKNPASSTQKSTPDESGKQNSAE